MTLIVPQIFVDRKTPDKRAAHPGSPSVERKLPEAGVMFAMAMWLLTEPASSRVVKIHPDGMHDSDDFRITNWLQSAGFTQSQRVGKTDYAGSWEGPHGRIEIVNRPGVGDVVGEVDGIEIFIEAKGGTINSRYPGHLSRNRNNLYLCLGQLFAKQPGPKIRRIAALPYTDDLMMVLKTINTQVTMAGIEVLLVQYDGKLIFQ
jgi:hypothetical protein